MKSTKNHRLRIVDTAPAPRPLRPREGGTDKRSSAVLVVVRGHYVTASSGIGKSHLAQALGHCAVRQGVDVVFTTCSSLTQSLNAARATGVYDRKLATLSRVSLLIIDDFGLKPMRAPADEDLHDLIAERYERCATIVTSNLDFDEWDQAFATNQLLASATLDRLRHNAYCLELDGPSYRDPKVAPASRKTPPKGSENTSK